MNERWRRVVDHPPEALRVKQRGRIALDEKVPQQRLSVEDAVQVLPRRRAIVAVVALHIDQFLSPG